MYTVVGCGECDALWVVEDRPETTGCPRCGRRHRFEKLRALVEADDEDRARRARAAMLADRSGHGEAFADLDLSESRVDDAGVDDAEYLEASGVDPGTVAAAGERAGRGAASGGGGGRRETVLSALRELDAPTEDDVSEYAEERGVPASYAREALEKLSRAGEVTENDGRYRLL